MKNNSLEIQSINNYINNNKVKFNKEIGFLIREWREKNKMTIEEFASLTLMNPSYVGQLEKGVNGISLVKFIMVWNALNISLKDILSGYLFSPKNDEDLLFEELQKDKNLSNNLINYLKSKNEL